MCLSQVGHSCLALIGRSSEYSTLLAVYENVFIYTGINAITRITIRIPGRSRVIHPVCP